MPKYIQPESDLIAGDDATLKQLVVEARAKIIWGERIRDVEKWLAIRGVAETQIKMIIASCSRERGIAIRRLGWRDIGIGSVPLALGLGGLVALWDDRTETYDSYRAVGTLLFFIVFGSWMAGRGVLRVIQGAKSSGSIPDME